MGVLCQRRGDHNRYELYQSSYGLLGHQQSLFIPGPSTSAGYTRSSTSSAAKWSSIIPCLYQVINYPLFIPCHQRFLVYTGEKQAIHTSDHCVGSTSSACTLQRSDFWAACMCGTCASAIHASGTTLGSEFPPTVQTPVSPKR